MAQKGVNISKSGVARITITPSSSMVEAAYVKLYFVEDKTIYNITTIFKLNGERKFEINILHDYTQLFLM